MLKIKNIKNKKIIKNKKNFTKLFKKLEYILNFGKIYKLKLIDCDKYCFAFYKGEKKCKKGKYLVTTGLYNLIAFTYREVV